MQCAISVDLSNTEEISDNSLKLHIFDDQQEPDALVLEWPFSKNNSVRIQQILNEDAYRLNEEEMYNDSLLNFGIAYFTLQMQPDKNQQDRMYIFCSLFYTKLIEKTSLDSFARYRQVYMWTKDVQIFRKEFLLFPIHQGVHFFLICYLNIGQLLSDSERGEPDSVDDKGDACILILDSMKKSKKGYTGFIDSLNNYLVLEYLATNFNILDICVGTMSQKKLLSRIAKAPLFVIDCPQQPKVDVSCGAYTVKNATLIAQYLPKVNLVEDKLGDSLFLQALEYTHHDILGARQYMFSCIQEEITKFKSLNILDYDKSDSCSLAESTEFPNKYDVSSKREFRMIEKQSSTSTTSLVITNLCDDVVTMVDPLFLVNEASIQLHDSKKCKVIISDEEWDRQFLREGYQSFSSFDCDF